MGRSFDYRSPKMFELLSNTSMALRLRRILRACIVPGFARWRLFTASVERGGERIFNGVDERVTGVVSEIAEGLSLRDL